jgi:uncharacterized lipoprotein
LAALVVAMSLAGCRSLSCDAPPSYGNDSSIPPLEVPLGLDAPDTRNALKIPDLNEPERPRTGKDRCLDEPPSYFPDGRVGESAAGDSKRGQ